MRGRLSALALRRVRVVQTGTTAKQAPAIDADMATESLTLDGVDVLADTQSADTTVSAVNAGGPTVIRDSTITHTATGGGAALYARGPLTLQRSTIVHGDADAGLRAARLQPDRCAERRDRLVDPARRSQRGAL